MTEGPNFTMFYNKLLEEFIKIHLSDYEHRVFLFILRKTRGYGKDFDWISLSQFSEATDIAKPNVCRTLKKLRNKNIVVKEGRKLSIQEDYKKWGLSKQITSVIQTDNKELSKQIPTKERNKIKQKKVPFSDIINYLNTKAEKKFDHNSLSTREIISTKCDEGYILDDFKKVIDVKVSEWKDSKKMDKCLRPKTLFGERFKIYLDQYKKENNYRIGISIENEWKNLKKKENDYFKPKKTFREYQEIECEKCAETKNYQCKFYKSRVTKFPFCKHCFDAKFWQDRNLSN